MQATFLRCIITCSTAIYASHSNLDIGVLPFAIGQLNYAISLLIGYFYGLRPALKLAALSIFPRRPPSGGSQLFPPELLKLSTTLYTQSLFKQLLTSGDAYLIALLTTLPSQGAYAIASNYGGLLARILFQPIEESSRSLLARLLPPKLSPPTASTTPNIQPSQTAADKAQLRQATSYLTTLLHFYSILSLILTTLAPPLTPLLLHTLAGPRWSHTEAPSVLSAYCIYLPLLAYNGILEAYVSAVATPAQLRAQSVWMVWSSALFGVTGWLVLGVWGMGARGLVIVNTVVCVGRIGWSIRFVGWDLIERGGGLGWGKGGPEGHKDGVLLMRRVIPDEYAVAVAVAGRAALVGMLGESEGVGIGMREMAKVGGLLGAVGSGVLYCERRFLMEMWGMSKRNEGEGNSKRN